MARFILDVANLDRDGIKKVLTKCSNESLMGDMVTITCIDETNENQFYNDGSLNFLSKDQINKYNQRTSEYENE